MGYKPITLGNTSSGAISSYANPLNISHTIANNGGRILFVLVTQKRDVGGVGISGVTYSGVAMTEIYKYTSISKSVCSLWCLLAPAVGTANVSVTFETYLVDYASVVCFDYYNVNQTTPYANLVAIAEGSNASPSNVLTATVTGESSLLVGFFSGVGNAYGIAPVSPGVEIKDEYVSNQVGSEAFYQGTADTTLQWTWTAYGYAYYAAVIELLPDVAVSNIGSSQMII